MLSERIKTTRQKAFLSQSAFAKELGVAFSTINRWETGKSKPNLTAMKALKEFCTKNNFPYEEIEQDWFNFDSQNKE